MHHGHPVEAPWMCRSILRSQLLQVLTCGCRCCLVCEPNCFLIDLTTRPASLFICFCLGHCIALVHPRMIPLLIQCGRYGVIRYRETHVTSVGHLRWCYHDPLFTLSTRGQLTNYFINLQPRTNTGYESPHHLRARPALAQGNRCPIDRIDLTHPAGTFRRISLGRFIRFYSNFFDLRF